jgi:gas vesicle protein
MRRFLSFMAGFSTGSLVGVAIAILVAPSSGEDLRTELQNRVDHLKNEMQGAAQARRAELEAQLAELRKPPKVEAEETNQ